MVTINPTTGPRIYTDGIFDLFHFGHALQLKQIKTAFPNATLVVGVCGDDLTLKHKGKTVLTAFERYESVRHCRYVDEVIEAAPWVITPEFMELHQLDYVAHDSIPYPDPHSGEDLYGWLKSSGRFIVTKRTAGVSTSDLITRILAHRNAYLVRNLERGVSPQELNLSPLMAKIKLAWHRTKKT
ncbi:MAG: adenylyltransferase/cytidyltransferase family protein [Oligoflexia bacterium]|nr:adenylyltransferase/cytidyltransferase family protein [Oligoflexia bacterium]